LGLRFGGNDSAPGCWKKMMLEENVVRAAGVANCATEENYAASFATPGLGRCRGILCTARIS